jgi:hypothetical protein
MEAAVGGLYPRWLEIIEEAENKGAKAVWIAEHHGFE